MFIGQRCQSFHPGSPLVHWTGTATPRGAFHWPVGGQRRVSTANENLRFICLPSPTPSLVSTLLRRRLAYRDENRRSKVGFYDEPDDFEAWIPFFALSYCDVFTLEIDKGKKHTKERSSKIRQTDVTS